MNFNISDILRGAVTLAVLLLVACGDGGGSAPAPTSTHLMGGAVQGNPLNLTPTVSTFAGTTSTKVDGTGTQARFNSPYGITSDGINLYVSDTLNNAIRKIVIATGVVTTMAGSGTAGAADGIGSAATFDQPYGITTDGTNLYVADTNNNKIRQIVIATGEVSSLTGAANTASGGGAADGAGSTASFYIPISITIDSGNLYVADALNNKIRKIVITSGVVSSFTGTANTAGASGAADGAATLATFHSPGSITSDGTNLYVADTANYKIRKIVIATGAVSSLTGAANTAGAAGAADGPGSAATFNITYGITTDGTNVYVADTSNQKIRKIVIATGVVSSFTGTANTAGTSGAADGAATLATFYNPYGLTTDGTNLYVADSSNNKIRQIVIASGAVTTFAGSAPGADGTGATGRFNHPANITTDGTNLYVADMNNNKIRKIVIASGVVTTLAGSPANAAGAADGAGSTATFDTPSGITTDGTNLYVADSNNHKIRKIVIASGMVSSLTGTANTAGAAGAADGAGSTATFDTPSGITSDGTNLYVADSNNHKIRKIVIASGMVSSLTGTANTAGAAGAADGAGSTATFDTPSGITTDGTNLYVADSNNHKIRKIVIASGMVSSLTGTANTAGAAGAADGAGSTATFDTPSGITSDGTNLYVADSNNHKIRKIVIASGMVSSLTGTANTAGAAGAADGAGSTATFDTPSGITTDGTNLYVADSNNHKIRNIVIASGMVSSLTGTANTAGAAGAADGAGSAATFSYPTDLTTDGTSLFVADNNNSTIRKIQ